MIEIIAHGGVEHETATEAAAHGASSNLMPLIIVSVAVFMLTIIAGYAYAKVVLKPSKKEKS